MRKIIYSMVFFMSGLAANAKDYYVSTNGDDTNNGTSTTTPWRSITKVNAFAFAAGDVIHFKCGETFTGGLIANANELTYTYYGTGAKPVINALVTASSWTAIGNGVYECFIHAKNRLNIVVMNGQLQRVGRYPNADAPNGGYLTFESSTNLTITDNQLSTTPINWTGADLVIRKNSYCLDRGRITSHNSRTLDWAMLKGANASITPINTPVKDGNGYFFQNDVRTLDQLGEWYFDTTSSKLKMFFGSADPSSYVIAASAYDTLFNLNRKNNIHIEGLNFTGANMQGVVGSNTSGITISNCEFSFIGARAIQLSAVSNILIDSVNIHHTLSNGITVYSKNANNVTIQNSSVKNNGLFPGMGSYYEDMDYKAITAYVNSDLLVANNTVDSVGLGGILFQGNNVTIKNNSTKNYCMTLHDNAGIYTYVQGTDAKPGTNYSNRLIIDNIVGPGVGNFWGTKSNHVDLAGIYLDGQTMNVIVQGNTVFGVDGNGLQLNCSKNVSVIDNTLFNNTRSIAFNRFPWGSIKNLVIKKNRIFSIQPGQYNMVYTNGNIRSSAFTNIRDDIRSFAQIDSNIYYSPSMLDINLDIYAVDSSTKNMGIVPYSLESWKAFTSYDAASTRTELTYVPYQINKLMGDNLFSNGTFTDNINGINTSGNNCSSTWDKGGQVNGSGSLKITFTSPLPNRYGTLWAGIGAVAHSKKYLLRYTTVGTELNGLTRAYISKKTSPYTVLTPIQTQSFGTAKQMHEFVFDAPVSEADARFMIDIAQNSGTTYIDDIAFYEVDATMHSIDSQVKLVYNDTDISKTVTLAGNYTGIDGTNYEGTISLPPFTSRILIKTLK